MTELTITPKVSDKTARFKGTIAAGEHVAVTIKGGAEWIGTDNGANLTLRVLDLVTGRTLAVFPYWTEDNSEDWPDGLESADAWAPATDDANDLYCELNLNTTRMVAAARHMLRVPVMFVLGDTDDPRTLYFRDRYEVEYWPERIGDTTPYDLDKWPKKIDDWTELVTGWTAKLNGMKLTAVPFTGKAVSGVSKNGVTITLNDGDDTTDTVVDLFDGEVSAAQMNAAIAAMGSTKQNTLTFDAIPTAESDNPVKSGGVKAAIDEVADDVTEHVGNTGIHVTAEQKTVWTEKYAKPQGGIPKSDLAQAVKDSLGKADTAVQAHQDLSAYVNGAVYDTNAKSIKFKHGTTVLFDIDATAFIKDGMVDSVEITGGNLVISFNTDAGVEDIEIPLTDIFDPSNYYDKTAADGRFVQKEAGKGLVAVDATLTTQGAAADAKAVGDALRSGFTEWVCEPPTYNGRDIEVKPFENQLFERYWRLHYVSDGEVIAWIQQNQSPLGDDRLELYFEDVGVTATRHLVTPTKTSQLTNDGDGSELNVGYVLTNDTKLSDARTPTAHNATHAANGSDPLAPADIGAAAKADLPYALAAKTPVNGAVTLSDRVVNLVEPVVSVGDPYWTWSDGLAHGTPYFDGDFWYISDGQGGYLNDDGTPLDELGHTLDIGYGDAGADSTSVSYYDYSSDDTIVATRVTPSPVSDVSALALPAAVPGKVRDFMVRLAMPENAAMFSWPSGVDFETEDGQMPDVSEPGVYLLAFTETGVGRFALLCRKVQEVE